MNLHLLQANALREGLVFRSAPAAWVIWLVIVPAVSLFAWCFYRMSEIGRAHV